MKINFYAALRKIAGQKSIEFDIQPGTTVRQTIDIVISRYPPMRVKLLDENGAIGLHAHVIINGRDAPLLENGLETELSTEETVDIFPIGHF